MGDVNSVSVAGIVKRDAEAVSGRLEFALEVPDAKGRMCIFDIVTTAPSEAYQELEGFVNGGERLEVVGHLEKRTYNEGQRLSGVWVDVRTSPTVIYAERVITDEGTEEEQ